MAKRGWGWASLLILATAVGLGGCGGGGGGDSGGAHTARSLRVLVTDAPFAFGNVKSATVEVQRVELHRVGAGEDAFETLSTFAPAREIDLVRLQNGAMEVLVEGDPAPGDYDQVRIVVLPKRIVIDDGGTEKEFPFKVPSGPQTGIKVFVAPAVTVATHLTTDLILDFDLSRSFVVQGNPSTPAGIKGFHFKPVVRAINRSTAGSLTFLVRSDAGTPGNPADDAPLNGAAYSLTDGGGALVAAGVSGVNPENLSQNGYVRHPAIPAGTYRLEVTAAGYDSRVQETVTIVAANLTNLGTITLAATEGAITGTVFTNLQPLSGPALLLTVEGARVSSGAVSTLTDGAGSYQLPGLPLGTQPVVVEKAGYATVSGSGTSWVPGTTPVPSDFTLPPRSGEVAGTVRDRTGTLVVGATVQAFAGDALIGETTTGAAGVALGVYHLTLPTGFYEIKASLGTSSIATSLDHVGGASTAATLNLALP